MPFPRAQPALFGAIGIALVVVSGILIATVAHDLPLGIDRAWHDLLLNHRSAAADGVARFLNAAGGVTVMSVVTLLIAVGLALRRNIRAAVSVALTVALASGISTIVKLLVARPRPADGIVAARSFSFPSGHATTAAAITVALLIAFPHVWSRVVASTWIVLMAVSRNYLLVHWLSDVIAGAVLGASVALLVPTIVRAVEARFLKKLSPDAAPLTG